MRNRALGIWGLASALFAMGCEDDSGLSVTQKACESVDHLAFGAVDLRTIENRSVRMENCGSFPIASLTAEVETDAADADVFYVPPATVSVPVLPEQLFSIPVAFRPIAIGEQTATLVIRGTTQDESSVEIARVPLSGTGVEPSACLLADPSAVVFETTRVGQSARETVTFSNVGDDDCAPSGLGMRAGAEHFFIEGTAPATLAPGESFSVDIVFAPTEEGTHEGAAAVVLAGREEVVVALSGEAVLERVCDLEGPQPVVFPRAATSFSTSATRFDVTNVGLADCVVDSARTDNPEFTVSGGLEPALVIQPGASAAIDMTFTPVEAGAREGVLSVDTVDGRTHTIDLAAFSDPEPGCVLAFDPPVAAFTDTSVGLDRFLDVTATNVGVVDCTLNAAAVTAGPFSLVSEPPSGVYAPGESFSLELRYAPLQEATSLGSVSFDTAEPDPAELALYGRAGRGDLVFNPPLTYFGGIIEGCASNEATFTLANVGNGPARIDALMLAASSDPNFEIRTSLDGEEIGPGELRELVVRMLGDESLATHSAQLRAYATGNRTAHANAELFGESLPASLADHDEGFVQTQIPQVDILFVVDNSGSMSEEQANLAVNFDSFISFTAQLDIDYHLAITTTDVTSSGAAGSFVAPFIRNKGPSPTPDPIFAFNAAAQVGTGGSGLERGLDAAFLAVSDPLANGQNAGFLRDDALLSLVFVSDEEDQSDGAVADFVERFLSVKDFQSNRVIASAIAGDVPFGCGSAAAGTRYAAIASALGGVFASVCDENFADAMEAIGLNTFEALSTFELEVIPEPSTIVVTITRATTGVTEVVPRSPLNGWDFVPERRVSFYGTYVPAPGDVVSISYSAQCIAP